LSLQILLCDDEHITRKGFRKLLEAYDGVEVVGEVDRPAALIPSAARLRPDVVIIESQLDGVPAPTLVAQMLDHAVHQLKVMVLSSRDDQDTVASMLRAGGGRVRAEEPIDGRTGSGDQGAGEALLAPAVTRPFLSHFATYSSRPRDDLAHGLLTPRELDVLRLLAEGLSNYEIARLLLLGEATVKSHVSHILAKLDLRDRVQAVVSAYRSGLVPITP
jgi:DNA-binding NarL/FixJ family response regulator